MNSRYLPILYIILSHPLTQFKQLRSLLRPTLLVYKHVDFKLLEHESLRRVVLLHHLNIYFLLVHYLNYTKHRLKRLRAYYLFHR